MQLFQINAAKYMYETHIIYGKMQLPTHPSSLSSQLYQAHQKLALPTNPVLKAVNTQRKSEQNQ